MSKKLYVGNIPFTATEDELRAVFERHGSVGSVNVIMDRQTGQSKGFAFVEMSSDSEAQKAMQELNGSSLDDREIKVNEAKPKAPRDNRGGGGGYGRGNRW